MALTSYEKFFNDLCNDIYHAMEPLSNSINSQLNGCPIVRYPRYNMETYDDKYVYEFDLPGVKKEEIAISESNGLITVKGKRLHQITDENPKYMYRETKYGSFNRKFYVANDANCTKMNAEMTDGVLKITIPKIPKVSTTRNIAVQ